MKPAIQVIGENKCTGCSICASLCPCHAIHMNLDRDGYLIPLVESDLCNHCGLCQQFCPIITASANEDNYQPKYYAAWSKDMQTRLESSSGGIFSELAKAILHKSGIVFGGALDSSFVLRHTFVEKEEDLRILRGSKYVQSHVGDAYEKAILNAKEKRPVLFSGTPCQIAALNNLAKKSGKLPELYTCEVLCHGVPPETVFREYLHAISGNNISHITSYSFRDKKFGWANFSSKATFQDGSDYSVSHGKDPFMIGYLKNLFLRAICYDCPFARIPRVADLTLGDFWGAPRKLKDQRGISVVVINSYQGQELFDSLDGITKFPVTEKQVSRKNKRLYSGDLTIPSQRQDFFNYYRSNGFQKASQRYFKSSFKDDPFVIKIASLLGLL